MASETTGVGGGEGPQSTYVTSKGETFVDGKRVSEFSSGHWENGAPPESVQPQGSAAVPVVESTPIISSAEAASPAGQNPSMGKETYPNQSEAFVKRVNDRAYFARLGKEPNHDLDVKAYLEAEKIEKDLLDKKEEKPGDPPKPDVSQNAPVDNNEVDDAPKSAQTEGTRNTNPQTNQESAKPAETKKYYDYMLDALDKEYNSKTSPKTYMDFMVKNANRGKEESGDSVPVAEETTQTATKPDAAAAEKSQTLAELKQKLEELKLKMQELTQQIVQIEQASSGKPAEPTSTKTTPEQPEPVTKTPTPEETTPTENEPKAEDVEVAGNAAKTKPGTENVTDADAKAKAAEAAAKVAETFESVQKQLEEKLKGVPPEDINKITRKFYLDHLPGYKLDQQRGVLADVDVIKDASGNVIKKINPFHLDQREKQTNEFLRDELRKQLETKSAAPQIDSSAEKMIDGMTYDQLRDELNKLYKGFPEKDVYKYSSQADKVVESQIDVKKAPPRDYFLAKVKALKAIQDGLGTAGPGKPGEPTGTPPENQPNAATELTPEAKDLLKRYAEGIRPANKTRELNQIWEANGISKEDIDKNTVEKLMEILKSKVPVKTSPSPVSTPAPTAGTKPPPGFSFETTKPVEEPKPAGTKTTADDPNSLEYWTPEAQMARYKVAMDKKTEATPVLETKSAASETPREEYARLQEELRKEKLRISDKSIKLSLTELKKIEEEVRQRIARMNELKVPAETSKQTQTAIPETLETTVPAEPKEKFWKKFLRGDPKTPEQTEKDQKWSPARIIRRLQNADAAAAAAKVPKMKENLVDSKEVTPQLGKQLTAIKNRLKSFFEAIDNATKRLPNPLIAVEKIGTVGKEASEQLKQIRDKAQGLGKEAEIRLGMIDEAVSDRVADATVKLAKAIGSGAVNTLKIGANIATEGAEVVATGILGGPAAVEEGVVKTIEGIQSMRINSAEKKATKLEKERDFWKNASKENVYQEPSRKSAENAREKVEDLRSDAETKRVKIERFRVVKRLLNGLFKKGTPNLEYKTPFNT